MSNLLKRRYYRTKKKIRTESLQLLHVYVLDIGLHAWAAPKSSAAFLLLLYRTIHVPQVQCHHHSHSPSLHPDAINMSYRVIKTFFFPWEGGDLGGRKQCRRRLLQKVAICQLSSRANHIAAPSGPFPLVATWRQRAGAYLPRDRVLSLPPGGCAQVPWCAGVPRVRSSALFL